MSKILTLKEFKEEVTPFIKAYKRDSACNVLDLGSEVESGGFIWFIEIWKWSNTEDSVSNFQMFIHSYKGAKDEEGEHALHSIESSNTMTEIVDFLCYEYNRVVLKRINKVENL